MKIKYIIIALLLPITSFVAAQQHIEIVNQFSKLELNGDMTVELVQADKCNITGVMTSGIVSNKVKWVQKNDKLIINVPSGIIDKLDSIHLVINVGNLTHLKTKGVNLVSRNPLTSEYLYVNATDAQNNLKLQLNVTEVVIETSNNCVTELKGYAKWGTLVTNMGSRIDAKYAIFDDCSATATFGSEIITNVKSHLSGKATYKSTIYYIGNPVLNVKKHTSSDIVKVDLK